ncbi:MAG: six-hairpin glycosidase [Bacteroidales bacterium]|nr:six-hairpin glycosidase [Bacteroidales bacterium]
MRLLILSFVLALAIISSPGTNAQDSVFYSGKTLSNVDYHHGQLPLAMGVHNIQVLRANREHPEMAEGTGWTYNHAPMLAYWNNTFYLEYLSDSVGEHIPPGQTLLVTSGNGYKWSKPVVIFPPYRIPDGTTKEGRSEMAKDLFAVMHQRMGFYVSKDNRLLVLGYYGICLAGDDDPNDGKGIGRVVREIYTNGSFGPIYFIRYNKNWNQKNTHYPFYTRSRDKGFISACDELMANPLMMQQWNEEADPDDPLIPEHRDYKAFNYYHLPDGRIVGFWKHAFFSINDNQGVSWSNIRRAPGFVNGNAKIWGQKTSDGRYAVVYNPSVFRWPLAISVSDDGLEFKNLLLVNGEISPMRYGGNYKAYGPQYMRGIAEGNGVPPDRNMWITYSMNKEDIWIAKIPVPVKDKETNDIREVFSEMPEGKELDRWNIFSPLWCPVAIETLQQEKCLTLRDKDICDYAKAERLFPESKKLTALFTLIAGQNTHGTLHIEFQDKFGSPAFRLVLNADSLIRVKSGYRMSTLCHYKSHKDYHFKIELDAVTRLYRVYINGKLEITRGFFAPVHSLARIVFRTGEIRRFPDADTPTDQDFDLVMTGNPVEEAIYYIKSLHVKTVPEGSSVLHADDFKHYADYFNRMEDENIIQAIPNARAWEWMKANIPLFHCPQDNFEELFYFRWWTLRKHIKTTPAGFAFTEFLTERSYADKYNLIACAIGHHINEARWLHDQKYLDNYIHIWYRGNDGIPLKKLHSFSNYTAHALYELYRVSGNREFLLDMLSDLDADFKNWEKERRLPNGLFWQEDVKDGMEESISGGRKVQNARPTINSYMYGNAMALSKISFLAGNKDLSDGYKMKADTLKKRVQQKLWNNDSSFFETLKPDGNHAQVREAIGYIPWMVELPDDDNRYAKAWEQLMDPNGFLAPFGMTTAERRHPEFRKRGCCRCEWDGAVWPFATSQTLTALANLLNNYHQDIVDNTAYFRHLELYVESQYYRGHPYIGEYLDETTGYWLKGDQERSRYYNHSTFNDLIITGLVGLRPRDDEIIEINPLLPDGKWDWFCLDNILYHGKKLTIIWDRNGTKYDRGKGLTLLINGTKAAHTNNLEKLVYHP